MRRRLLGAALAGGAAVGVHHWLRAPGIEDPIGPDVVLADDGVALHVEIDDLPGAPTVVLVHGFTARIAEWELQRETLRGRVRVVAYDQRGHGASGWGAPSHATLDQLGRDLGAVLDRHATTGPVVLVAHSMGGMTVMALARQRPELFGSLVAGVFLLATSPGDVLGDRPVARVVALGARLHQLDLWLRLVQMAAPALQRLRRPGSRSGYQFTRDYLFGDGDADPAMVRVVQELLEQTPFSVSAAFYSLFVHLDEIESLDNLRAIPVTLLAGAGDRMTPAAHSRAMADRIGESAELIIVPGAGHSVNLTRRDVVDHAILALIDRAVAADQAVAG